MIMTRGEVKRIVREAIERGTQAAVASLHESQRQDLGVSEGLPRAFEAFELEVEVWSDNI